jgi:hypothetical protein
MIIGIAGKAGAGKDTVASMLIGLSDYRNLTYEQWEEGDYNCPPYLNIVHFADSLKETAKLLGNLSDKDVKSQEGKLGRIEWLDMTVREFLQKIGTAMRTIDEDFWVKSLMNVVDNELDNVIIADVRYPNEVKSIKDRGGIIIRINRPGAGAGDHSSEIALDDYDEWDCVIDNNKSLKDLFKTVKDLFLENLNVVMTV